MTNELRHVATFCGDCDCGCPEIHLAERAAPERRVVLTDDFGQRIEMGLDQLAVLVSDVKAGLLDSMLEPLATRSARITR